MNITLLNTPTRLNVLLLRLGHDFPYRSVALIIRPRATSPNVAMTITSDVDEDGKVEFRSVSFTGESVYALTTHGGSIILSGKCKDLLSLPAFMCLRNGVLIDSSTIAETVLPPAPEKYFWRMTPTRDSVTNLIKHVDIVRLPGDPNDH